MMNLRKRIFGILGAAILLLGQAEAASSEKPNVIFILMDDMGYSDIGCYGATKVKTPHIDRLAAEGLMFTNFHAAASICSPSRAAFLTGAYPQRAGLYLGINPKRDAHWFLGLHPDEITIAEQFKGQGYETHMIGKWHLGTEPEFLPRKQGFDHYYGMPCNYAHSRKFFDDGEELFANAPLGQLTKLYTDRAVELIQNHASSGTPFFLFYSHNYPHTPYKAGKEFVGSSEDGERGDVMQELDWSMGEIVKALDETGINENTLIIFTSDNGPVAEEYAKPFRGTKYVSLEGGHRVPFILHWPARIVEGGESDANVNAMDVFPTLTEAMGGSLPTDRVYDGESLLPLLEGGSLTRLPKEPFYYYNCDNLQAIRTGDWKLHLTRKPGQVPWWDKNRGFTKLKSPVLYDLKHDPGESENVAEANPEVVAELLGHAESVRKELGAYLQRGSAQRPTGSIYPDAPVIGNSKDWDRQASPEVVKGLKEERARRYGE